MNPVRTHRPENLAEALDQRREYGAAPYAGGTDLMPRGRRWMGLRPALPQEVMFIGHLVELQGADEKDGELILGSCCRLADLMEHQATPGLLKRIIGSMASPGVRNLATLGGNICNASPAGDTLPYLYAMGARLRLESVSGDRELGISEFLTGPGQTALADDEILTAVILPKDLFNRDCYEKVAPRRANALTKVSFLGMAQKDDQSLSDLRLAFGAVGPTVVRSGDLEKKLLQAWQTSQGGGWPGQVLQEMLAAYGDIIRPIDDQRSSATYRKQAALGLLRDFLENLA